VLPFFRIILNIALPLLAFPSGAYVTRRRLFAIAKNTQLIVAQYAFLAVGAVFHLVNYLLQLIKCLVNC
jgi:hypothetical protein